MQLSHATETCCKAPYHSIWVCEWNIVICPQMTQRTQIKTRTLCDVVGVNRRDLRKNWMGWGDLPTGIANPNRLLSDLLANFFVNLGAGGPFHG